MTHETEEKSAHEAIELVLARLLRIGSLLAAGLLGVGICLMMTGFTAFAPKLITTGLLFLLSTPILRVFAAAVIFVRERDWYFAMFSAVVLCSLALGVFLGSVG